MHTLLCIHRVYFITYSIQYSTYCFNGHLYSSINSTGGRYLMQVSLDQDRQVWPPPTSREP